MTETDKKAGKLFFSHTMRISAKPSPFSIDITLCFPFSLFPEQSTGAETEGPKPDAGKCPFPSFFGTFLAVSAG